MIIQSLRRDQEAWKSGVGYGLLRNNIFEMLDPAWLVLQICTSDVPQLCSMHARQVAEGVYPLS